ncbi:MAG TPA: AMP-dependent synthetase/ligase [Candidatus Marinimicrobia bacterium]|nr:AMP-dependent synthetase/ligase [Candidatus Neomarinimicrobiota bacterium]
MITPKYLLQNIDKFGNEPALSVKDGNGEWITDTWNDFYQYVLDISKSLLAYNIDINEKISIYSYNRREWYACYAAAQYINSVAVGIYHTSSSSEVEWIVSNSNSKILFVGNNPNDNGERDKMPIHRLFSVIDKLDNIEYVVLMGGVEKIEHSKIITWENFISKGSAINDSNVKERNESIKLEDTSSLIYTSGTTGNPKGVELTYNNWKFEVSKTENFLDINQGDRYVSWLPLAHVFGQLVDNHVWIKNALHMYVVDSPLLIIDFAKEVRPHIFIGVPRIYEKIYSNLKSAIESKTILKIGLKLPILSVLLKKKLKDAVGFTNIRYAASGAAPINPDILKLFHFLDIPLFEGYGMTENTAVATVNYHGSNKIGSVGKALHETEIKLSEEGEVLLKGQYVMKGYYKNEEATNESIIDGWLYTGDIGSIDSDGFLSIIGRKKEIYVSSGGKNIAPLVIEETMKSISILSQCFLIGDNRRYCSALFTLDVVAILRDKVGIETHEISKDPTEQLKQIKENGYSLSDFTENKDIKSEIQSNVNELNRQFSNPEQIKKFSILPRDFTIDHGELTPTLKMRRKQINENWSDIIETMYID